MRWVLGQETASDWEQDGRIRLVEVERANHKGKNTHLINANAPRGSSTVILLVGEILHEVRFGRPGDRLRTKHECPKLRVFERLIGPILRGHSLDWRRLAAERLSAWIHAEINVEQLESWLRQFTKLNEEWLGEHLLRTINFCPTERLRSLVTSRAELHAGFDYLCLNLVREGKSGDFLANLCRKALQEAHPNFPWGDFRQFFANSENVQQYRRIVFIEDGLFTGTEMTNFLSALLGLDLPPGRDKWSYERLPRPDLLRQVEIEMRFAAGTDLGVQRLKKFLQEQDLVNIRINVDPQGWIPVLTSSGQSAFSAGHLYEADPRLNNCIRNPSVNLLPPALRGPWMDERQKGRAGQLLYQVGEQLFRNYLAEIERTATSPRTPWADEKIAASALGMHSLGLQSAFAHSVPKASLPVFWMGGLVKLQGRKMDWKPLFLNAAL